MVGWEISWLVQVTLDLQIPSADAVGLVPMEFNTTKLAVGESDGGDALQLPPPAATTRLSKERSHRDADPCRNGLDLLDRPDQLESHCTIFA